MSTEEPTSEPTVTSGTQGGPSVPPPPVQPPPPPVQPPPPPVQQPPPPPPQKKTGLIIGIVAAAVVVLIILIVAASALSKQATAPSPSAPPVAPYTTVETCNRIIDLPVVTGEDPTPEQVESLRSEIQRAPQPLKGDITALVAAHDALALNATAPPDPATDRDQAKLDGLNAQLAALKAILEVCKSALSPEADAAPSAEPAGLATTIDEGDWTVGVDIKPGTYRTTEPVSGDCYWGIYRAGSNQSDIIDNAIVKGGRPTVTLKKGQEFKNQGCGTFALVK